MKDIFERIDELLADGNLPWTRTGRSVVVQLWRSGRKQRVSIEKQDDMYSFKSVVLKADQLARKPRRRDIVYKAWRRNASKDLVSFGLDDKGNLIGQIQQPVATIDHEEIEVYVEALARECDRFEYALTGEDVQ